MGFLYHFVRLDPAQEAHRRQLLDNHGQFAQISALIPLLYFQLIFATRFLLRKWNGYGRKPVKVHQSPRLSVSPKLNQLTNSSFAARLRWALDEEISRDWGTRLEWLIGAVWTVWLLFLTVKDTGDGACISLQCRNCPVQLQLYDKNRCTRSLIPPSFSFDYLRL